MTKPIHAWTFKWHHNHIYTVHHSVYIQSYIHIEFSSIETWDYCFWVSGCGRWKCFRLHLVLVYPFSYCPNVSLSVWHYCSNVTPLQLCHICVGVGNDATDTGLLTQALYWQVLFQNTSTQCSNKCVRHLQRGSKQAKMENYYKHNDWTVG